jgi:ribonuclease HIII
MESDGKQLSDKAIDALKTKVKAFNNKNILHLNQIKLNYGNKQREDSEAIQEV